MDIRQWITNLQLLIDELTNLELGYPLGENCIKPPLPTDVISQLATRAGLEAINQLDLFYKECNGIDLPDVWNGYFVLGLDSVCDRTGRSEICKVDGIINGRVVVFGSDGGGGTFAVRTIEQDILHLANGQVHCGIYLADKASVKIIAQDFAQFLDRLLEDVKAFVQDTPDYAYMI